MSPAFTLFRLAPFGIPNAVRDLLAQIANHFEMN
jgi:hypothetical protein